MIIKNNQTFYKPFFSPLTMGTTLIKLKIMPSSTEVDLSLLENTAKEIIEAEKGENLKFEQEPIAFGLKAIIAGFSQDESQDLDAMQDKLRELEEVSSAEVIDMRRAFG